MSLSVCSATFLLCGWPNKLTWGFKAASSGNDGYAGAFYTQSPGTGAGVASVGSVDRYGMRNLTTRAGADEPPSSREQHYLPLEQRHPVHQEPTIRESLYRSPLNAGQDS